MSLYNSGSESDHDKQEHSNSVLNPLDIAKAFANTVVDPELGPPSKEHQEWADKLLSDLTPRSRKGSSRKHSKTEDKRSHPDRRSSHGGKSSSSLHKKRSNDKDKESSSKSKSLSRSLSISSSPGSSSSKKCLSQVGKLHTLPPASGMNLAAGFPPTKHVPRSIRERSHSPSKGSSTRKRSHPSTKSKSGSLSPHGPNRVSHKKQKARSRSKSPPQQPRSHNKNDQSHSKSPLRLYKKDRKRSKSPPQEIER